MHISTNDTFISDSNSNVLETQDKLLKRCTK